MPSAMWTESMDSPLIPRGRSGIFHGQDWCKGESVIFHKEDRLRQYVTKHLSQQVDHKKLLRDPIDDPGIFDDSTEKARLHEKKLSKQIEQKKFLDEQTDYNNQKARESLRREAHDASVMKMQTAQALCNDLRDDERRRADALRDLQAGQHEIDSRAHAKARERTREKDAYNNQVGSGGSQQELNIVVAKKRLEAAQEVMAQRADKYDLLSRSLDVGRANKEDKRTTDDERRHNRRMDAHYLGREVARERQRLEMVQTLGRQLQTKDAAKELERMNKSSERQAIVEVTREHLEQEMHNHDAWKAKNANLQRELVAQMAEKDMKRLREGGRSTAMDALQSPLTLDAGALARATGSFDAVASKGLSQRVDASRFLGKPLGRAESPAPPSVRTPAARPSPSRAFMEKSLDVARNDKRLAASWSGRMSQRDLKNIARGKAAALAAANA